jgi:hypothetical protein
MVCGDGVHGALQQQQQQAESCMLLFDVAEWRSAAGLLAQRLDFQQWFF